MKGGGVGLGGYQSLPKAQWAPCQFSEQSLLQAPRIPSAPLALLALRGKGKQDFPSGDELKQGSSNQAAGSLKQ